jgi:hypothetical protein
MLPHRDPNPWTSLQPQRRGSPSNHFPAQHLQASQRSPFFSTLCGLEPKNTAVTGRATELPAPTAPRHPVPPRRRSGEARRPCDRTGGARQATAERCQWRPSLPPTPIGDHRAGEQAAAARSGHAPPPGACHWSSPMPRGREWTMTMKRRIKTRRRLPEGVAAPSSARPKRARVGTALAWSCTGRRRPSSTAA